MARLTARQALLIASAVALLGAVFALGFGLNRGDQAPLRLFPLIEDSDTRLSPAPGRGESVCPMQRRHLQNLRSSLFEIARDANRAWERASGNEELAAISRIGAARTVVLRVRVREVTPALPLRVSHALLLEAVSEAERALRQFAFSYETDDRSAFAEGKSAWAAAGRLDERTRITLRRNPCR